MANKADDQDRYQGVCNCDRLARSAGSRHLSWCNFLKPKRPVKTQRPSTAEVLKEITGGGAPRISATPEHGVGADGYLIHSECDECRAVGLYGIPAVIGTSEEFPLTSRPGEYLGQPRDALQGMAERAARRMERLIVSNHPSLRQREGDQPLPVEGLSPPIHDLCAQDIQARKQLGIKRYGRALQAGNGRDGLRDAYEELLDACAYLRQLLWERDER